MTAVTNDLVVGLSACLSVVDLDRSARWYRDLLGFVPLDEATLPGIGARVAYLGRGDLRLELVETTGSDAPPQRPDPPAHTSVRGISQISVYVRDLDAVVAGCSAAGIELAMAPVRAPQLHVAAFFVRDPDGNLIEFLQHTELEHG